MAQFRVKGAPKGFLCHLLMKYELLGVKTRVTHRKETSNIVYTPRLKHFRDP